MWHAAAVLLALAACLTAGEAAARPSDQVATLVSGIFPLAGAPIAWFAGPRLSPRTSYRVGRFFLLMAAVSAAVSMYNWRGSPIAGAMAFQLVIGVVFAAVFFSRRDVTQLLVFSGVVSAVALLGDGFGVEDVLVWTLTMGALIGTGLVLASAMRSAELLSYGDPLTGAANRRAWQVVLDEAVGRHRRTGETLSILLIDLDRFKEINDRQGHDRGDAVLRDAAEVWRSLARVNDTLARLGGDEFVLLLEGTPLPDALAVGARLIDGLRLATGATCSIGVATLARGGDVGRLLTVADMQLYAAKAAGRACVRGAEVPPPVDAAPVLELVGVGGGPDLWDRGMSTPHD